MLADRDDLVIVFFEHVRSRGKLFAMTADGNGVMIQP